METWFLLYEEALGILELLTLILVCTIPDLAKLG